MGFELAEFCSVTSEWGTSFFLRRERPAALGVWQQQQGPAPGTSLEVSYGDEQFGIIKNLKVDC